GGGEPAGDGDGGGGGGQPFSPALGGGQGGGTPQQGYAQGSVGYVPRGSRVPAVPHVLVLQDLDQAPHDTLQCVSEMLQAKQISPPPGLVPGGSVGQGQLA